jgi:hypothetical protein
MIVSLMVFLFLINMATALGINVLFDDSARTKYLKSKWVRVLLLVPPIALVLGIAVLVYGILFTIYLALAYYLSDNQ